MGKHKESSNHEFTDTQNKLLRDLAIAMAIVAVGWFLYGGQTLYFGSQMFSLGGGGKIVGVLSFIVGAILIALGAYLTKSTLAMKAVVETEGDDVNHFMRAMDGLRSYFKIFATIIMVVLTFALIGILMR